MPHFGKNKPEVGKGVTPPAKLPNIISDLFQNQKIPDPKTGITTFYTYVLFHLSEKQKKALPYPPVDNLTPLDVNILYQIDQFDANNKLVSPIHRMASFTQKGDGFIYGYYFTVLNQKRVPIKVLTHLCKPFEIDPNA